MTILSPSRTRAGALRHSALFAAAVAASFLVACAGPTTTIPCGYTPDSTPKTDPLTVFRAKSIPCYADSDCHAALVTPRCSAPELAHCDKTQPSTKLGICVFQLTGAATTCNTCYEGDIRYCDANGAGSCTPTNMAGCGIQSCAKTDNGNIPPPAGWQACVPLTTLLAPKGTLTHVVE